MRSLLLVTIVGAALGCSNSGGGSPPEPEPSPLTLAGRWVGTGTLDGVALMLADTGRARYTGTYERRDDEPDGWVDAGEAIAEERGGGLVRFYFGSGGRLRFVEGDRDPGNPDVVTDPAGDWTFDRSADNAAAPE